MVLYRLPQFTKPTFYSQRSCSIEAVYTSVQLCSVLQCPHSRVHGIFISTVAEQHCRPHCCRFLLQNTELESMPNRVRQQAVQCFELQLQLMLTQILCLSRLNLYTTNQNTMVSTSCHSRPRNPDTKHTPTATHSTAPTKTCLFILLGKRDFGLRCCHAFVPSIKSGRMRTATPHLA